MAGILNRRKSKDNSNTLPPVANNNKNSNDTPRSTSTATPSPTAATTTTTTVALKKPPSGTVKPERLSVCERPFKAIASTLPKLKQDATSNGKANSQQQKQQKPPVEDQNKQPPPPPRESKIKTQEDLSEAVTEAKVTQNYTELHVYFERLFSSFQELIKAFKIEDETHNQSYIDLNMEYLDYMHQTIIRMPKEIQKVMLRSVINCMLRDHKGIKKSVDDLRGYLIFLMNPVYTDSSTYVVFAHVLRQIAALQNTDHHYLIAWFRRMDINYLTGIIDRVKGFIAYKLFPTKRDIPEGEKSAWWIPQCIKVLALLNAANEQTYVRIVPTSTFYIQSVELLDLVREYQSWQSGSKNFSFCQYPFVLSLRAKRYIMQKDSETKMLLEARQTLVSKVRQKQKPNMGMLFLNLDVRRNFLLEDSLREISSKRNDLKKKLRIIFKGEPGIDLGGVSKEWFFLLMQKFFREDYGMFKYSEKTHTWWFTASAKQNFQEYNLCGVLMGLAIYNGINLDIRFPPVVYKKVLSPAIVPFNNPHAYVGVVPAGLDDLKQVYPDLAKGLGELLEYAGNVEEDLCQSFLISFQEFGQTINRHLKPNGDKIPVTNENRQEYVNLYCDYLMNKCIYQQFYSFYHGFHSVCASNALLLLRPDEVETLVIGNTEFNLKDLESITKYDGYNRTDSTIRYFWEAVHDFEVKLQRKLLLFSTGSDRVPVGGFKEMKFKITKISGNNAANMLPMAHTCFNQLCLPAYKNRKVVKAKLLIAIENCEGFGLE